MEKWSGAVAVVTGASSGIGKAVALTLARHGVIVAALARRDHLLRELEGEWSGEGGGVIRGYGCDVTSAEQVSRVFSSVRRDLGPVRILVNNAGQAPKPPFLELDVERWRNMFEVNVFGMFECIKRVVDATRTDAPGLVHIVNMNSLAGHYTSGNVNILPYAASKHCVTLLTRGLLKQVAEDRLDIRVTSLSPGLVRTDIMRVQGVQYDYDSIPHLEPQDVARALIAVLQQPADVVISELTIKPAGELN